MLPDPGTHTTVGVASTASVAVGVNVAIAPVGPVASIVWFGVVTVGAVVSTTVTLNDPLDVLFESSVAVQVTGVVPSGKVLPDAGTQATVGVGSPPSVAVAVNVAVAPVGPVASTVWLAGTVNAGAVVSTALIVTVHGCGSVEKLSLMRYDNWQLVCAGLNA